MKAINTEKRWRFHDFGPAARSYQKWRDDVQTLEGLLSYSYGEIRTQRIEAKTMTKLTEYLYTAEAAEFLGVHHNTIRNWAARGELPMHRNPANGYRLFKRSDLDAFLKKTARPIKVTK